MKALKWTVLTLSAGVLLQAGACATDFLYFLMQGLATQVAATLVRQALGSA